MNLVIFSPVTSNNNYLDLMKKAVLEAGYQVAAQLDLRVLMKNAWGGNIVFVHWLENRTLVKPLRGLVYIASFLLLSKILGYSVWYMRHNRLGHDISSKQVVLSYVIAVKLLHLFSSRTFTHGAKFARQNKIEYIPHPLYDNLNALRRVPSNIPFESFLLCFGRINPYKKIDKILREFPREMCLVLCGPADESYLKYCLEIAQRRKLKLFVKKGMLSEEELNSLILASEAVIVSNDGSSSIVSGQLFHAISLGVPVCVLDSIIVDEIPGMRSYCKVLLDWSELRGQLSILRSNEFNHSLEMIRRNHDMQVVAGCLQSFE